MLKEIVAGATATTFAISMAVPLTLKSKRNITMTNVVPFVNPSIDETDINPFSWGDIELSQAIIVNGAPHITKTAIGEWLEYEDPRTGINRILNRNSYIDDYSTEVKLTSVDGKKRETKIYHPIGFLLIVMESGQPKAQAMKVAVADFVWNFAKPTQLDLKDMIQLRNQRINIIMKLDKAKNNFAKKSLLDDLRTISLLLGETVPDESELGIVNS